MRSHDPKLRNMANALSLSVFIAFKETNVQFYLLLLQLVLCRVADLKSLPVHHS